jgi:hypothetical protein
MRRTAIVLAVVASLASAALLGLSAAAAGPKGPPRAQWEYKVVELKADDKADAWEKRLADLGDEGWEVAGTGHLDHAGGAIHTVRVILKRPK